MRRVAIIIATLLVATAAFGQIRGFYGRSSQRPRYPTAGSFDGRFNFCRGQYRSGRQDGSGNGWTTDYPDADINFTIRLSELTKTHVSKQENGDPNHLVIRFTDPFLYQCPFIDMTDVGEFSVDDQEAAALRAYLDKGGFIWVDDFWGEAAWNWFATQIGRVLPPNEFPIVDVPLDHPIYRMMFQVAKVPQIPSINFWRGIDGNTSELGEESAVPHMRAIFDKQGRIIVLITHNTDISDAWEREAADPRFFFSFSPNGYAVGINAVLYAMTH